MKNYILTLFAATGLMFTSCDDILERPEQNYPSDATFWTTESDARLFANGFYPNFFIGYGHSWSASYSYFRGYMFSDDVASSGQNTNFLTQAPTSGGYDSSESIQFLSQACGPNWQFSWIRKANLMMERLENQMQGKVSDEATTTGMQWLLSSSASNIAVWYRYMVMCLGLKTHSKTQIRKPCSRIETLVLLS